MQKTNIEPSLDNNATVPQQRNERRTLLSFKDGQQRPKEDNSSNRINQYQKGGDRNIELKSNSIKLKPFREISQQSYLQKEYSLNGREQFSLHSNGRPSRQQIFSKQQTLSKLPYQISALNTRLIQSFLQKLSFVEQYALTNQQAYTEYIELIYQLKRNEGDYAKLLGKKKKRGGCFDIESYQGQSLSNRKLKSQLSEDIQAIRSFANKHQLPLYRKDHLSPSLDDKPVHKFKKRKLRPFYQQVPEPKKQQSRSQTLQVQEKEVKLPNEALFPSLKLRKREAKHQKERYRLGVSYLKENGRMKQKSKDKKSERGKIILIKQIIHHWKVDNSFLRIKTQGNEDTTDRKRNFTKGV